VNNWLTASYPKIIIRLSIVHSIIPQRTRVYFLSFPEREISRPRMRDMTSLRFSGVKMSMAESLVTGSLDKWAREVT